MKGEAGPAKIAHKRLDPITTEVIRHTLLTAADEMKGVVMRTAFSDLWKEAGDLSCAIMTAEGEVVAQGSADIPIHLPTMPYSLRGCLARLPADELGDGDVFLMNDPFLGNNHLPDLFMAKPVLAEGEIIAYTAVRGHFIDVGGSAPGSYSTFNHDVHGEGFRLPPVLIYKAGELNGSVCDILLANVRAPGDRLGDLHAQYSGCVTGDRRVKDLYVEYGASALKLAMEQILAASETRMRARICEIPPGVYEFEDWMSGAHPGSSPLRIACELTVEADEITVDFSGSAPQSTSGINMPLSVTAAAALYAVKAVTEPTAPANSGSYRPIHVRADAGTITNCRYPAGVVGGNHETSARVADCVLGALSKAVPDRVVAAGSGTSGVVVFGGDYQGESFVCYEVHGAGQGASSNVDGGDAQRVGIGNTGNTPVEVLETHYPLTVLEYGITADGGGPGRRRGGCGIRRRIRFDAPGLLTLMVERDLIPPYGLGGGLPAPKTEATLTRSDGTSDVLAGRTHPIVVQKDDVLFLNVAGGGGYGPPEARELSRLQDDVDDGFVSAEAAGADYGATVDVREGRPDGRYVIRATASRRTRREGESGREDV